MFAGTFNVGNGSLTAVIDGSVFTVDKSHDNYNELLEYFKTSDKDNFLKFYKQTKKEVTVEPIIKGTVLTFDGSDLYYNGNKLHHTYVDRIVSARENGFPIEPMLKFFENLLQNPSQRSLEELPDFLMNRNLPITEDGCFLAYKSVSSDWYSKASGSLTLISGKADSNGRIFNGVGEVIECLRNEVDDERGNECSKGLHVGGLAYSGPGGWYNSSTDKVVIVKVNPKDVVSVPKDHDAQKVRTCRYEVVEEFKQALNDNHEGVEANLEPLAKTDFNIRTVNLDNLARLDTITFEYKGLHDTWPDNRYMIVEEIGPDYVFGTLLSDDPSYEEGNESRKFMKSRMSNVEYFDEDEYDDDDEDDWGM